MRFLGQRRWILLLSTLLTASSLCYPWSPKSNQVDVEPGQGAVLYIQWVYVIPHELQAYKILIYMILQYLPEEILLFLMATILRYSPESSVPVFQSYSLEKP